MILGEQTDAYIIVEAVALVQLTANWNRNSAERLRRINAAVTIMKIATQ